MEIRLKSVFLFIALLLFSCLFYYLLFGVSANSREQNFEKFSDYLYSTPIIKTFRPKFSLDGAFIKDNTRKNNFLISENKNEPKSPAIVPPAPSILPSATPKPTALPQKNSNKKTDVNIADKNETIKTSENINNDKNKDFNESTDNFNGKNNGVVGFNKTQNKEELKSEWLYKLRSSPVKGTMNDFVAELGLNKVDKNLFYEVLSELLNLNDERTQYISIYGLAATPSFKSFEMLAIIISDKKVYNSNVEYAQKVISYYNQSSYVSILLNGLKHPRDVVVLEALSGLRKISKAILKTENLSTENLAGTDGRIRRESLYERAKKNSSLYENLMSQLQELSKSNDSMIASTSEMLIDEIQF